MIPASSVGLTRLEAGAPPRFARLVAVLAVSSVLVAVIAIGVDVAGGRSGGTTSTASGPLAGLALILACIAVVASLWERGGRSVGRRRLGFTVISIGFVMTLGIQAALYVVTAGWRGPAQAWVEDVPLLAGVAFLGGGVVVLCWPPGLTRNDVWQAMGDTLVAAMGALVVWVILVVPGQQPADSPVEEFFIRIDVWALYAGVVAVALIAATSRRTGALPVRQLILVQLAILVYIVSDTVGDTVSTADRQSSISYSIAGYSLSMVLMVAMALRPDIEPETERSLRMRDVWAVAVPMTLGVASVIVAAAYWLVVGAFPGGAAGLLAVLMVVLVAVTFLSRLRNDAESRRLAREAMSVPLARAAETSWFAALLAESRDLVVVVDRRDRVVFQSPSVTPGLGIAPGGLIGRDFADLVADRDAAGLDRILQRAAHDVSDRGPHELVLIDARGLRRETECVITPLQSGDADGFVITARDVSDRRRLRAELAAAGSRDRLTGLSNRDTFVERLREMVPLAAPRELAVVALDVIGFRDVNDSRGHDAGDHVLKAVAGALDALPGTVAAAARLAGDEFTAVVTASPVDAEVAGIDRDLRAALQRVAMPDGHHQRIGFHLGYAVLTEATTTAADLLERADLALREARSTGRDRVRYSDDLRAGLVARLRAEADLREALDGGAVVVHYQPVVHLLDGTLTGVEALVRLRAPDGALVPPVEFIARAEQLGLVDRVGDMVLDQALHDVGLIGAAFGHEVAMAVNVSPSQLGPGLVDRVSTLLVNHGVPAERLIIEITEETLAKNHAEAADVLARLRERGVGVALDDFGTGYSSLSYLAGLPVDELKIDRSFVSQMGTSTTSLTLVRTVVQLAQALDLVTVAEGVETPEQADLLRGMGCGLAQGFLFARPMPLDELLVLSRDRAPWLAIATMSASASSHVGDAVEPAAASAPVVAADVHSADDR